MELTNPGPNDAVEQPPNPAAAKAAAREARRMLAASCWPLILFAGLTALPVGGAVLAVRPSTVAALAIMGTWLAGIALQQLVWARRRGRAGPGYGVAHGEIRRTGLTRGEAIFVAAGLGGSVVAQAVLLVLALSDAISKETLVWGGVLHVLAAVLLVPAGYFFWHAARSGLWECWYMGGAFPGTPVIFGACFAILRSKPVDVSLHLADFMWLFCLAAAVALVPGGLFLRRRWRRLCGSAHEGRGIMEVKS